MEQKSKVINGTTYIVSQMGALKTLTVQAKLLKVFGPAIGELKNGKLTKETIREKAMAAIFSLAERMDEELVVSLVVSLFETGVIYEHVHEGKSSPVKVVFDTHFTGKITEMWKAAFFVLEVNFSDIVGKFRSSSLIKEGLEEIKREL